MLLWCTSEFGYLRLADGFVQCSSIMPQKRNPVALEHARAIASKAVGQAGAILLAVHNTPFGDIVDTEDDLQPLVHSMFTDASRAVMLVAAPWRRRISRRSGSPSGRRQGWITVTELADTLTRDHNVPFKTAHAIASRFVAESSRRAGDTPARVLRDVSESILGRSIAFTDDALAEVLSPEHFVRVRKTPGGPAPEESARAIARSRATLLRIRTGMGRRSRGCARRRGI